MESSELDDHIIILFYGILYYYIIYYFIVIALRMALECISGSTVLCSDMKEHRSQRHISHLR